MGGGKRAGAVPTAAGVRPGTGNVPAGGVGAEAKGTSAKLELGPVWP